MTHLSVSTTPADSDLHVVIDGPTATRAQRAALTREARAHRAAGFRVTTSLDVARDTADTFAYARAMARAILDSDGLFLTRGWERDAHAAASQAQAESLRLPVFVL